MTANLILIVAVLLILHRAIADDDGQLKLGWMVLACLILLPLCFGPFVVISYYLFEAPPDWLFWPGFLLGVSLLLWLGMRVFAASDGGVRKLSFLTACVGLAVSLGSGLVLTAHESGLTPKFWDFPMYIPGWAGAISAVLALSTALACAPSSRRTPRVVAVASVLGLSGIAVFATFSAT